MAATGDTNGLAETLDLLATAKRLGWKGVDIARFLKVSVQTVSGWGKIKNGKRIAMPSSHRRLLRAELASREAQNRVPAYPSQQTAKQHDVLEEVLGGLSSTHPIRQAVDALLQAIRRLKEEEKRHDKEPTEPEPPKSPS